MNVNPRDFYRQAAEERAEDERKEVVRENRAKGPYGNPPPPNYSVSFAKKLRAR